MTSGRFANLEMPGAQPPPGTGQPAGAGPGGAPGARVFIPEDKDAQAWLREGVEHEFAGDFEPALRSFSSALNENPLLLAAWVGQLWMLLQLEEYPEAKMWADKALEQFPEAQDLLAAKSLALFRMGQESEARALNDTALQKKGESALVWLTRGEIMVGSSRAAAEECFQHALRIADREDATLLRIVGIALRYRKYSLALSMLKQAIAQHPDSAQAWYLQGQAQEQLGLAADAAQSFAEAAELAPDSSLYKKASYRQAPGLGARLLGLFRRVTRQ